LNNFVASAQLQADLALADPQGVASAFERVAIHLSDGRWLGQRNFYRKDTVQRLKAGIQNSALKQRQIAEYVAASVPLHASDGWGYLGRSMHAHLMGDRATATHLAYYAELRAAMTVLAAHGIGVFDRQHFVVTGPFTVEYLGNQAPATHQFTWQALQWWASQSNSWRLIGEGIRPDGVKLEDWIAADPTYATWGAVASGWVSDLGLDLQRVASDQFLRNVASYRPHEIGGSAPFDASAGASFAVSLWRSLEPGKSGFPLLDRHFLRITADRAYRSVSGKRADASSARFQAFVDNLASVGARGDISDPYFAMLQSFLLRKSSPFDLRVFRDASNRSDSEDLNHHLYVMSRAAIMLVLASAAARRLISNSSVDREQNAFWWERLGADRGLWRTAPHSDDLLDLWQDIRDEIDIVEDWIEGGSNYSSSLIESCPRALTRLSQLEIAGIWGLAG